MTSRRDDRGPPPSLEREQEARAREIPAEDVDDVIEAAARRKLADEGKLSLAEVESIAEAVQIPARYVAGAVDDLAAARSAEAARAEATRTRAAWVRRGVLRAGWVLVGLTLVLGAGLGIGVLGARSDLRAEWAAVEQARAQVANVVDRRARVRAQWVDAPPGPDRDAELSGAENRVSIERRRYDERAAAYNLRAGGLLPRQVCGPRDAPCRAPLSSEVTSW